ncbi:MAG: hypothetical protein Tp1138SUR256061_5 [Prokaryotic dsDNA virus sp.]|nr:MAG: hypothetical protein Tp1138SUR256061_5 [Prokaryotic dsDNA virus sp.]|tara:strand:- start:18 stop:416 length:399 start_codon:yes stop_codon:yes gene_type:complete
MKQILAKIFGAAGGGIAEKISNIVAKHTFSKEDQARFEKEMTEVFISAESEMQKNVTARWEADANSDSWLSKNVRPMVLIFLVVSSVLMVFIDAGWIEFEISQSNQALLTTSLTVTLGAYFGGRSFEKIRKR